MYFPNEHWLSVATVYRNAAERGEPPTLACQDAFDKPRSTVSRWIATCRRLGYLSQAERGEHAYLNAKALAVSGALGVTYKELIDAVREHADGDLRV